MPRKLIKRYLPDRHAMRQYRPLRIFGRLLHNPNLWHLNRYSTSGAVAVGLFLAFMPIPFQMLPAAALAIALRLNLPLAVAFVWVTNPFTIPPIFYFSYRIGAWVIGNVEDDIAFAWSWEWFRLQIGQAWEPFLVGTTIVASVSALLGYFGMRALWRWRVLRQWENRKKARARKRAAQQRAHDSRAGADRL